MARYAGPKTKISRNLENQFLVKINHLKKEIILGTTEIIEENQKNLNMLYS